MRIVDLERRQRGGFVRIEACLVPEVPQGPTGRIHFEVPEAHGAGLRLRGDPFLLASFVPAMEAGEERIVVEGEVCPVLGRGVAGAARVLSAWSPDYRMPRIESAGGFAAPDPLAAARTASTFAGGVDSLATLYWNRRELPLDHPASIRDGLFVFGFNSFDHEDGRPVPARERDYEARLARWQSLAASQDLELIPLRTNVRTLAPSFETWARRTMGAGLAAAAHALGGRWTRFLIPSAGRRDPLHVDGTHPALDPLYGSASLQIVHDGLEADRLEKLRALQGWEGALTILQPCQQVDLEPGVINCGDCNKCRRTMLELEALGCLEDARGFPSLPIDRSFVEGMRIAQAFDFDYLDELEPLFEARGRPDLASALVARRRRWERGRRRRRRWIGLRRGGA